MVKARVGANPLSKIFQSIFWSLLHTKSQPQLLLGQACLASTTNECSYWPRSLLLDHFNPSSMQPLVLSEFADFLALSQVSKYSPASAVGRGSKTSRVITAIFWPYWFVHQILPVFFIFKIRRTSFYSRNFLFRPCCVVNVMRRNPSRTLWRCATYHLSASIQA